MIHSMLPRKYTIRFMLRRKCTIHSVLQKKYAPLNVQNVQSTQYTTHSIIHNTLQCAIHSIMCTMYEELPTMHCNVERPSWSIHFPVQSRDSSGCSSLPPPPALSPPSPHIPISPKSRMKPQKSPPSPLFQMTIRWSV